MGWEVRAGVPPAAPARGVPRSRRVAPCARHAWCRWNRCWNGRRNGNEWRRRRRRNRRRPHTDDAATKLSDRVRCRCFDCCTAKTSTWRRSNLRPGKVVRVLFLFFFT
ncbi:hypothetical protein FB451DRAFT_1034581 [Mycena latifolia]|nr:hypothetical protein FB451DRAFT_1034581 [Mycena latifolia]